MASFLREHSGSLAFSVLLHAALTHNALLAARARVAGANDYSSALPDCPGMPYGQPMSRG